MKFTENLLPNSEEKNVRKIIETFVKTKYQQLSSVTKESFIRLSGIYLRVDRAVHNGTYTGNVR